ncbi:unnamed protein product [Mytilus edulis]|uniref:Uncharacterized protein n=1 Tax=Mytilus edulis TaxID=6550 RepID=A0A8S3Q472_MYTED|nr:unnamed protein product [Mytilus edulis]
MTILTAGSCFLVSTLEGNSIPSLVGSAAGAFVTGVKLWVHSQPLSVALGTAIGTGMSSGAIAGAIVTKTFTSGLTGAIVGGLSSAGVGSVIGGCLAAASATITSSPIGLLTVGTSTEGTDITHDCWKQIVHDSSLEPSNGILLKDLVSHCKVSNVTVTSCGLLPHVVIQNIWNEKFELEYVVLQDSMELFCHVTAIL